MLEFQRSAGNVLYLTLLVNWQAEAMAERKGITLPQEFLAAAAQGGLRQSVLLQYALLQVGSHHCS